MECRSAANRSGGQAEDGSTAPEGRLRKPYRKVQRGKNLKENEDQCATDVRGAKNEKLPKEEVTETHPWWPTIRVTKDWDPGKDRLFPGWLKHH